MTQHELKRHRRLDARWAIGLLAWILATGAAWQLHFIVGLCVFVLGGLIIAIFTARISGLPDGL